MPRRKQVEVKIPTSKIKFFRVGREIYSLEALLALKPLRKPRQSPFTNRIAAYTVNVKEEAVGDKKYSTLWLTQKEGDALYNLLMPHLLPVEEEDEVVSQEEGA
jgi:hypothetical protein